MAVQVNVHEAKTHLSRLLERVALGEEIVIARAGVPVARLTAVTSPAARLPGSAVGLFALSADFDDPLADDLLDEFEA